MDFSELRVGHRLKCVREYELLPFKVDTEYEVVNVNDGRVIICEVGHKDEIYPLDISICMDYFEFSPSASPVVRGFRIEKEEKKPEEQTDNKEDNKIKESLSEIGKLAEKDLNTFDLLVSDFGLNYPLMELTKSFENFKNACYSDIGNEQYYEILKVCLLEISKVSVQTISWIEETKDYDGEMEEDDSTV
jgi:hypothetical protein